MAAVNPYSRLETPTLVINHCNDASCSHPSCWTSRKLYKRNAYLLMLKGVPASEIRHEDQPSERPTEAHRDIPTQKVHNIVDELFRGASDPDDWQPAARGISAGQLSIKHMPTPMSSLSRNASKLRHSEEFDTDTDDEVEETVVKVRKSVGQIRMQEMFRPSGPHSVYHSREYVWVPNPNRKPRTTVRRSEQDAVGRFNINEELGQYLQEDTYNLRQAALQERAVERSHLSTARVQRFFKSCAQASSTKHVDLFKLPSDLLSEVLRNVDQGEPMTNESLARMVEEAEAPAAVAGNSSEGGGGGGGGDFERHVLRQRRAQLHNSEGRNLREPQKHTARSPVFLTDDAGGGGGSPNGSARHRLPPIGGARVAAAANQQQLLLQPKKRQTAATAVAATSTAVLAGQFKRSIVSDCQLMLGPVGGGRGVAAESPSPKPPSGGRRTGDAGDDAGSMDVECRSDRSTLLDEVLPSRQPGMRDSGLAALLARNRPSYDDLDDPWADMMAEGPHPTTRNDSMLMTMTSSLMSEPPSGPAGEAEAEAEAGRAVTSAGVCLSLSSPVPVHAEVAVDGAADEAGDYDNDEGDEADQDSLRAPPTTGRASPGPPPPSPDVEAAASVDGVGGGRASSPPPRRPSGVATAPVSSKAKSAASSAQMPTLNEDEEGGD